MVRTVRVADPDARVMVAAMRTQLDDIRSQVARSTEPPGARAARLAELGDRLDLLRGLAKHLKRLAERDGTEP